MPTTRPFAYNTGSTIVGTIQIGDLAIGVDPLNYAGGVGGVQWWGGPDEDLGYVIAHTVPSGTQPTQVPDDAITLSTTYKGVDISVTNNNQTAAQLFGYQQSVLGETIISGTNKVMFSVLCNLLEPSTLIGSHVIGVGTTSMNYQGDPYGGYPGNDIYSIGFSDDGNYYYNGSVVASGLPTWTDGDTIDIAISHGQYWWVRVNGGDWNNNPSANPTTLANGLTMNGLTNFYPVLCPSYQGIMTVLNYPKYGVPSEYNFLGNVSAYLGFWRSDFLTESSFIGLAEYVSVQHGDPQTFITGASAKTWLNNNGYWTSYDEIIPIVYLDAGNNLSYSGSGSIWYDLEGVSNNATLINTPTYSSNYSGILSFDDVSSEYSTIPDIGDLNTWTVEVWFRLSSSITSKVSSLVTNQFNGVNKLNFSIGTNNAPSSYNLVVGFYDGAWRNTTGFAPSLNTWYQVVGTYDGSVLRQYVNGVASGGTLNYVGTPQSGGEVRLMRRWDSTVTSGNLIDGDLSIVKIYNTSLDSTQVLNNYNENAARFIDPTPTPTPTTTITPTVTVTPTITPTVTVTPTITPTITPSITRTITPTPSITPSPSTSVVFSQTFTSGVAPGSTIENAWTTFRGQLTGTYTKFDFTSSNGQGYTGITDAVKVQQIANALRTGTTGITFATTISGVTWNVGCCTCRNGGALNGAVEFANVGLCSGSSTAALRPFINNNNWGGIGSTVGAATQTLTLRFY